MIKEIIYTTVDGFCSEKLNMETLKSDKTQFSGYIKKRMRKGLQWLINEDDLKSPTSLCCTLFSPGDKKRNKSIVIYVIFIYVTSFII